MLKVNIQMRKNKNSGFTIVELLIVIVVIGILAALVLNSFAGAQEKARLASAKAYASQIKRTTMADATGYWSFDDCSGSVAKDSSDKGNDGTIIGTATWSNDTPTGSGCSLSFNGSTRIETTAGLSATYYLKAAWIKLSACSSNYNIISQAQTGGSETALYAPNCIPNSGHNGAWGSVVGAKLDTDKWYHIAVEYNSGTMTLLVDGKQVKQTTGVAVPNNPTGYVSIGGFLGGNYFLGLIDDPVVIAR